MIIQKKSPGEFSAERGLWMPRWLDVRLKDTLDLIYLPTVLNTKPFLPLSKQG